MDTLTILNTLSRKLVWNQTNSFNKAASIYSALNENVLKNAANMKTVSKIRGIGHSYHNKKMVIDFFIPSDFDVDKIKRLARKLEIPYRTFRTMEFISYVKSTIQKPIVMSGNAIQHHRLNGFGTLGGYVSDVVSDYRLAISNNHVIGLNNKAKLDDKILYRTSSGIIDLGGLYRLELLLKPPAINVVDAAVSWIREDVRLKWAWKKPSSSLTPRIGMDVYKIGARTGYTEGIITGFINHTVNYGDNLGQLNFFNSLNIQGNKGIPFSLPGDSGSLIFNKKNHKVVGLLFAGDNSGTYSFANSIKEVEKQLLIII